MAPCAVGCAIAALSRRVVGCCFGSKNCTTGESRMCGILVPGNASARSFEIVFEAFDASDERISSNPVVIRYT